MSEFRPPHDPGYNPGAAMPAGEIIDFSQFNQGPVQTTQAELANAFPQLFAPAPESLITAQPESEESIQAFTAETAKAKLDGLPFLTFDTVRYSGQGPKATFTNSAEGFQIPVDRIISANGHGIDHSPTWAGRRGGYERSGGERSIDKILRYAKQGKYEHGQSLEERAVVDIVYGPDGQIYYVADGGNHRVSAAKLRGDATFTVKTINVPSRSEATLAQWAVDELYNPSAESMDSTAKPEPQSDPVAVWIKEAPDKWFDRSITLRRTLDGTIETWTVDDGLYVRKTADDGSTYTVPTAILKNPEGHTEEVNVGDLLRWHESALETAQNLGESTLGAVVAVEPVDISGESSELSRADVLFMPIDTEAAKTASIKTEDEFDFSALLDPDSDWQGSIDKAAVRHAGGRSEMTESTIKNAVEWLDIATHSDKGLQAIIDTYRKNGDQFLASSDVVKRLRYDADMRKAVGMFLLEKVDRLIMKMPKRIRNNTQKRPGTIGYDIPNLSSREYTALLALSFLDGSFNNDKTDAETYDFQTDKGVGQHRYAARQLLATWVF
jgi:hypothetical protein